ncbi:ZIP family metal transporter [Parahaliea aestuarii]|uniref:ZIP family zinc transporter n=1 Tax=Parahaliea aestuarii TaxID=1852021 RepID=A0A5C9A0J1_9GAMM|nr:ZIP family zinc transporter [Parahaliea aestuarii]TXS93579.1 ZIP family zinc transporter [Parahaliea aestuarii]
MSPAISALFWGFISGGALILGAAIGFYLSVPRRIAAGIMAFGSGVLISALSFELMGEAFASAGLGATAAGFLLGAIVYAIANRALAQQGAKHRKRSGEQQPSEDEQSGSGTAIALGALLDGVPESIVIGLGILHGGAVSIATVAAIFLSNLPEGISSSAGMRKAGRSAGYVFGVWTGITLACALSALAGYTLFDNLPNEVVAATTAVAAGAMLTMIVDTMIPEAFAETRDWAGLIAVLGFLVSFGLSQGVG